MEERYRNKLILAPMVRVGTLPMRLLALEFGAHLVYTEELIDWKLSKCERRENKALGTIDFVDLSDSNVIFRTCEKERGKVILQIGTSDVDRALKTAKLVEKDVSGIDINMGCPKEFSVKGGMGVALAANVEKAKAILETLVKNIALPITCKIRISKTVEETLELVQQLASTGISAIAIHCRTKDERPQHPSHPDIIKAVVEKVSIPIICNGGSKEIEKYGDIQKYREQCGTSSIMIARAAEWNPSIFRKNGMLSLDEVLLKYLKIAIEYDNPPANTKYCIQNMLRELQDTPMGKKFLEAQTMEQICDVWGLKDYCKQKQKEFQQKGMQQRWDITPGGLVDINEPLTKKIKLANGDCVINNLAFIRSSYNNDRTLPKSVLHAYCRKKFNTTPTYETYQNDKLFQSVLTLNEKKYSNLFWEKNKKFAEQGAALVCMLHLELIDEKELIKIGSMSEA